MADNKTPALSGHFATGRELLDRMRLDAASGWVDLSQPLRAITPHGSYIFAVTGVVTHMLAGREVTMLLLHEVPKVN